VTLAPHLRGARIQVIDTGVGIGPDELPHIFDRFYRGSRANEARGSGSGLGLAIVRSIVEMHGGRVMVESRMGSGTTFTVTLPADPRTSANAVATGAVSPKSAGPATAATPPRATSTTQAPAEAVADSAKTQSRTQAT
jgi:DNA topoisomerase VI subunit B